jgi:uncharacterized protein (TIGR03066 family)
MRAILAGLAVAALTVAAGGYAAAKDEKVDGKLLVGKWTPKEADKKGKMFLEFTKDGKLSLSINFEKGDVKKELKAEGTYKLDGNKLAVTIELFGMTKTDVLTVSSLTKTELVTVDEKGKKDTLVRAADKK